MKVVFVAQVLKNAMTKALGNGMECTPPPPPNEGCTFPRQRDDAKKDNYGSRIANLHDKQAEFLRKSQTTSVSPQGDQYSANRKDLLTRNGSLFSYV